MFLWVHAGLVDIKGGGVVHSESRSLSFNHECPAWASTGDLLKSLFQGFLQQLRQIAGRMSSGPRGAGLGLKLLIGAGALAYTVKEATYTGNPQSLWKHEYSAQLGLWSLTLPLSWSNLSYLVWQSSLETSYQSVSVVQARSSILSFIDTKHGIAWSCSASFQLWLRKSGVGLQLLPSQTQTEDDVNSASKGGRLRLMKPEVIKYV